MKVELDPLDKFGTTEDYSGFESIQRACWTVAEEHGWHEDVGPHTFVEKLILVHSELSEALEEFRDGRGINEIYYSGGKPEGVPIELADAIIRLMDLAEILGINLGAAVREKQAFNDTRAYKHGGKTI